MSPLGIFLLECALLVALPMLAWRYMGLRHVAPLAMIQIAIGLALGPSILGRLMPNMEQFLFPSAGIARLDGISAMAVTLFTFVSGMRLDESMVARSSKASFLGTAASAFLVPLILGTGLGYWLAIGDPGLMGKAASLSQFSFGFGICLAVTALPVLASILAEMDIVKSPLGQRALAFAAFNDAILWIAVFVLVAIVAGSQASLTRYFVSILVYLAVMFLILPRLLRWLFQSANQGGRAEASGSIALCLCCALAFLSAMAADEIGLGYILGAFLSGVVMPAEIRSQLLQRLDWAVAYVLMPFFFMVTGLRIQADLVSPKLLAIVASAVAVATVGKILGVAIPLITQGEDLRSSLALGALMQSKGLMEVLVITVLSNAGIVGPEVFSVIILVAMICTIAARPLATAFMGRPLTDALKPSGHPQPG